MIFECTAVRELSVSKGDRHFGFACSSKDIVEAKLATHLQIHKLPNHQWTQELRTITTAILRVLRAESQFEYNIIQSMMWQRARCDNQETFAKLLRLWWQVIEVVHAIDGDKVMLSLPATSTISEAEGWGNVSVSQVFGDPLNVERVLL